MLQIINQAMLSGFTASQILKFIAAKMPKLQSGIQQAEDAGFDADKILKFLSQKIPHSKQAADKQINANDRYLSSIGLKTRAEKEQSRNKMLSGALQVGAGALGSYALSRAIPAGVSAVSGLLKPQSHSPISQMAAQQPPESPILSPSPQQPPISPMPVGTGQNLLSQAQSQTSQPPLAGSSSTIPQPPTSTQVVNPQRDVNKSIELIKSSGQEATVKNLIEGGLPPSQIVDTLGVILGKKKLKELEKASGGLEQMIEDYSQSMQSNTPETPQIASEALIEAEQAIAPEPAIEEPIEPAKSIAKGQVVSSPKGIGQVVEIRNGKAIIEVAGKRHQFNEDELEIPEFTDDEIADAYDDLMRKIPEPERSRFISWAGYDEDRRVLGYIPRGGKYEELTDITPEEAELIKTGKGVARTTGESREGYHIIGGDTRGLISQIQHDRRKKREAEDKKQLKLFELPKREKEDKGMKPIFDEMAYARGLSRERDRKKAEEARVKKKAEKEEEKTRIKKEKDEAKKRKK